MDIIDIILGAKLGGGGGSGSSSFIPSFGTIAYVDLGTTWAGNDPYTSTVTVTGYTVTDKTMVSVLPSTAVLTQMLSDGTTNIFITNNNGVLTATAHGAAPTYAMTLTVLCTESDQAAAIGNLAGIVGDGVLEVLGATDLTDAINILNDKIENLEPGGGAVNDVQINGTSILNNGVANIPNASTDGPGVVRINADRGITLYGTNSLQINAATSGQVKNGGTGMLPLTPYHQHESTFYGLAKAAGDTTMPSSSNAVGTYTEAAKTAIRAMLGVTDSAGGMNVITLTGTTITQTAAENTMYKCGELAELTFTAPASGITAVRFSSGSTPTVASFPGVTWLGDFDPDNLIANVTYEINIFDGVGVAGWA